MDEQFNAPVVPPAPAPPISVTPESLQTSVDSGKNLIAALSYISLLVIIPLLVSKDNPFVKFHAKQGLSLLIFAQISWILSYLIGLVYAMVPFSVYMSIVGIYTPVRIGFGIVTFVFVVIGIRNVLNKRQDELPLIGGFAKMFTF